MSHLSQQGHPARAELREPPDRTEPPVEPTSGPHPSRRQVIAGAGAGLGLVASGALAGAAGSVVASGASSGAHSDAPSSGGDVVAHVRDAATGDIDVFFGDQQVRIRDRAVAARLSAATR